MACPLIVCEWAGGGGVMGGGRGGGGRGGGGVGCPYRWVYGIRHANQHQRPYIRGRCTLP